jgi:hypothetical protein
MADGSLLQTKQCNKCDEIKCSAEFHKRKDSKDGLAHECKLCTSARSRMYYEANREAICERVAIYAAEHVGELKEYQAAYRAENPAKVAAARRRHFTANHEHVLEQNRQYKKLNPTVVRASNNRRRSNILGASGSFTSEDWNALVAASPHCHWCKRKWTKTRQPTHDHVVPITKGGANDLKNSVCSCLSCNSSKGNRLVNPCTNNLILL